MPTCTHPSVWAHHPQVKTESLPCDYWYTHATIHSMPRPGKIRKLDPPPSFRLYRQFSTLDQLLTHVFTLFFTFFSVLSFSLSLFLRTMTPGNMLFILRVYHILTIFQRRLLTFSPRVIVLSIPLTSITADGSAAIYMVPSSCTNTSSRNR